MELKNIREKIDQLDLNLLDLVNQRASLALEIGQEKRRSGQPVLDENREKLILDKLVAKNSGPLSEDSIKKIFQKIIEENRILQQRNSSQ